jgi:hypothetical protein
MAAPRFHRGDTLSLALRADPRDGGTNVYAVHVTQVRRCDDGTRYLLARPNGTSVYLWDMQLAKLLHTWHAPPPPEVTGATATDA